MNTSSFGPSFLFSWSLMLLLLTGAAGQAGNPRGDVSPDGGGLPPGEVVAPCSCKGSVVAGVIITAAVFLVLAAFWWCFQERRRRKLESKPDPEAVNRAAYDNPHFQGDDLDQPNDGQARINAGFVPPVATTVQSSTTTTTIATSTTSTLERGKSTLERVMAAVIRGSRSDPKRTKDDSCLEPKDVVVPLEGHDFIGLGFTVQGNLKEGLYVKEVMSRGPANESGKVMAGDRIVALTVLTDHMVFKDALTILSYASPYPVLLHLRKKKTSGSVSATSSLSSKVKLNQTSSNASEKLIHPAFRSQSHGDLAKIEDIDIKRLKMGNLIPPSKGKHGLGVEPSKTQVNRLVQRKTESRHSERAIDVPGVDIKTKSCVVDIDAMNGDKVELTNVQVHQPMTPKVGIDFPDTSIEIPTFQDANLSGTAENLKGELEGSKNAKPNSKTKFGVKVFPDLVFKKSVDLESGLGNIKIDSKLDTLNAENKNEIEVKNNEENSQIELGLDRPRKKMDFDPSITTGSAHFQSPELALPSSLIKIDKESSRKESEEQHDDDSKTKKSKGGFGIDLPDINMPSFGFKGHAQNSSKSEDKENDDTSKKTHEVHLQGPEISIPAVNMELKSKHDEDASKSEDDKKKSKHGFKIDLPDINMPSFKLRGHGSKEKDSDDEGDHDKRKDKKLIAELNPPGIDIPSVRMQTQMKSEEKDNHHEQEDEKDKNKSKHGFRFGMPDIHMPSFGLRGNDKKEKHSDNEDDENHKEKYELKLEAPSVAVETDVKTGLQYDHKSDDKKAKKEKHSFKIGMPDFNMPSLHLKGNNKSEELTDNKSDEDLSNKNNEISAGTRECHIDIPTIDMQGEVKSGKDEHDKEKSKHEFKLGMPDLHMPSFNLRSHGNKDKHLDKDKGEVSTNTEEYKLKLEGPDVSISSVKMQKEDKHGNIHDSESEDEKEMKKSKHGFKFGMPDINIPSFSLKGHGKNDKGSEDEDDEHSKRSHKEVGLNLEGPDVKLPSVSLETEMKSGDKHDYDSEDEKDKKKSKHGFKFGMPSFGFRSHGGDKESEDESSDHDKKRSKEIDIKLEGPNVNLPSVDLKTELKTEGRKDYDSEDEKDKKKSKHGFKIGMPSFGLKSHGKDEIDFDDESNNERKGNQEEINVNMEVPNVNLPSVSLKTDKKSSEKPHYDSDGDNDKKKSKHGFKFEMPDISMPSFGLRGHGKSGKNSEDEDDEHNKKESQEFVELQLGSPSMNVLSANVESGQKYNDEYDSDGEKAHKKSKHGFKIGMPSFGFKGHGKNERESDDECNDEKEKSKKEIEMKMEGPNVNLPSVSLETQHRSSDKHDYVSDEEKEKKKSKHGFKFEMPDISMPSFGIKAHGKGDKDSDAEDNEHSKPSHKEVGLNLEGPDVKLPSVSLETEMKSGDKHDYDSEDENKKKSKHGFKFGMPSFGFRSHGGDKDSEDESSDHDKKRSKEIDIKLDGPNLNLPSVDFKTDLKTEGRKDYDSEDEKDKKKSKHGFKIGMPSFGLKTHGKEDKDSDDERNERKSHKEEINLKMEGPNIDFPKVSLETQKNSMDKHDYDNDDDNDKKGSKHGFKFGMPDISMPSFGIKGHGKDDKDSGDENDDHKDKRNQESELKLVGPDVNLPSVSLEAEARSGAKHDYDSEDDEKDKKKSKHGFKIGMPSFGLKSHSKKHKDSESDDNDLIVKQGKEYELKLDHPDIDIRSVEVQKELKKDDKYGLEATDEKDKKKSKHGFKIGMPDINMPSFSLKGHKSEKDSEDENDREEETKHNINIEGPNINMPSGKIEVETRTNENDDSNESDEKEKKKSKHGFKMPSFGLRGHTKNDRFSDDEDNERGIKKDSEEIDFKFKTPHVSMPSVGIQAKAEKEGKPEHELEEEEEKVKSKHGFKINMPDINMPSFNLGKKDKGNEVEDAEEIKQREHSLKFEGPDLDVKMPGIKIRRKSSDDDRAAVGMSMKDDEGSDFEENHKKSKYGFKIGMPDINIPTLTSKERVGVDHEAEISSKSEIGHDFHLESPEIKMTSGDATSKKSKYELNLDMPDIKFPSFSSKKNDKGKEGTGKDVESTHDIRLTQPNFREPSGNIAANVTTSSSEDKPDYRLKFGLSDTDIPSTEFKQNLEPETSKLKYSLKADQPSINISSMDVKMEKPFRLGSKNINAKEVDHSFKIPPRDADLAPTDSKNMHFKISADDSALAKKDHGENREKLRHTMSSDSDPDKKSKDDKKKKEKSGFNFKFKGPDFSFPHFGHKNEKGAKEAKLEIKPHEAAVDLENAKVSTSQVELPYGLKMDTKFRENSETLTPTNEEINHDLKFQASSLSFPSSGAKINQNIDFDTSYKIKTDIMDSVKSDMTPTEKDSENFRWKMKQKDPIIGVPKSEMTDEILNQNIFTEEEGPAFKIPHLKSVSESAEANFDIPKVGISTHKMTISQDFKDKSSKNEDKVPKKSEASISMAMPDVAGEIKSEVYKVNTDYSLPDEVKVVNSRSGAVTSDKGENYDFHVNLPSADLQNIKIRRLSDDNFSKDRGSYEQKIRVSSETPDLDAESLEGERDDGLNVTDATKKKRSGFKLITSEVTLPALRIEPKQGDVRLGVDEDENQSDEMKTFHLKLKTPSSNIGKLSEHVESKEPHKEMYVHLPRVKISNIKAKDGEEKESWSEKLNLQLSEDKHSSTPSVSLPKFSLDKTPKENESDERKMNEVDTTLQTTNVSLLREKFNIKMKENTVNIPGMKAKAEMDIKPSTGKQFHEQSFNLDDPDFIIPDFKSQPAYDSPLLTETFNIPALKMRDTTGSDGKIVDKDTKWRRHSDKELPEYHNHKLSESDLHSGLGTGEKLKPLDFNVSMGSDINVSLDSSSVETESDLPEADSDLKKATRHYSLDVPIPKLSMTKMNLEKSFHKDSDIASPKTELQIDKSEDNDGDNFGSVFGFRGFRKHVGGAEKIEVSDNRSRNNKDDSKEFSHDGFAIGKIDSKLSSGTDTKVFSTTEDLPEVDYDLDFKAKSYPESDTSISFQERNLHLPEGDQNVNYSVDTTPHPTERGYKLKQDKGVEILRPELEVKAQKKIEMELEASKPLSVDSKEVQDKPNKNDSLKRGKRDEDDDKTKSKIKIGLGFGFKGFNKASDSDENESENKISKEPEGDILESKEKIKSKPKKTFSFKGFGKSSSDTEEENLVKVSEHPMEKGGLDDKSKINKTSINFGFKQRNTKSSDSDDNGDNEKVELNPQVEGYQKKSKIKSNLGFGFMNKSKLPESDTIVHSDTGNEDKKEQYITDDNKGKAKSTVNISVKGSRDNKSDTRSESEGGEEERMSMDSRGEDHRSKPKYGIGFGFKKGHGKTSSDSECGEYDEQKVYLDERGSGEKAKEPKSKSLKLGFKGFKNLKGKIQTEINKIRHDSPSSDEESISRDEEVSSVGEKRKKLPKKKDKDKKIKREVEKGLDAHEEAMVTSVALAAKENRRKKFDSKTSSSSSDASSDDEEKPIEQKKKKKSKLKRKEEGKIVTTNVIDVSVPQEIHREDEVNEHISASHRSFNTADISQGFSESHVTIVRSEPNYSPEQDSFKDPQKQSMEIQTDPRKYVVVREMKLKENISQIDSDEVTEVIEKVAVHNDIPRPLFLKERAMLVHGMETGGSFWASDSDMENRESTQSEVNLSKTSVSLTASGKQRVLTDSEELKRKAASLGDLSRLHEGGSTGTPLERAVSLDLKNASVGHPSLHIRRLQLPDSSATSIDEVDEHLMSPSPKKLEITGGLKAASQWGTLEEAMNLGLSNSRNIKSDSKISTPSVIGTTTILKTTSTTDEGAPISNIEISGERGSSITAVLGQKDKWNDSFEEEDELPSLPSSPVPVEKTTITVVEEDSPKKTSNEYSGSDSSIVVVGSETIQPVNNFHNLNFQLNPTITSSQGAHLLSSHAVVSSSNTSINSDSGRYSPRPGMPMEKDDTGGVTITMVPAESHVSTHIVESTGPSIARTSSPIPSQNRTVSSIPELVTYDNLHESSHVTVSHNWVRENGDVVMETSEHNISDEFITPDSTPQKSMTQITLDGDGVSGYTVTEGTISRTVIISNSDSASPVSIVQTDNSDLSSMPQMK